MRQHTPDLAVDSVTGVDVALPVAGPGARSFAFLIDWHIRAIVGIAWYVVAALIYNGRWSLSAPLSPDAPWFIFVVTPPMAIYFLYHYVLELAMHGRTPGKRTAGVHIVARDGGAPTVGALLIRNVFRLVDSLPLFYGVGLIATLVTRDHVRIGDMAAGTLIVYDRIDTGLLEHIDSASLGARLDAESAELINELLLRWSALDVDARHRLAGSILSRHAPAVAEDDDEALRVRLERLARASTHGSNHAGERAE
jgi:uncharacterized RDD family membrane protein YckC